MRMTFKGAIAAVVVAAGMAVGVAAPAQAVQYAGGYYPTSSQCRAAANAYRADGWTIIRNCEYTPGYGYLIDARRN